MLPYLYIGDTKIALYGLVNTLGLYAAMICNLFLLKQKQAIPSAYFQLLPDKIYCKYRRIFTIAEVLLVSYVMNLLGGFANGFWAFSLSGGGGNYFGLLFLAPPLYILAFLLLRIHPLKQLDLYTPSLAISLVFFKIACHLHGCCEGQVWEWGVYNVHHNNYRFPSQLLEMSVALALFIFLLWRIRKPHIPGTIFPLYTLLFSATRFFTEFTREAEFKYWGLCSYQIQCLMGIFSGLIWFLAMREFGQSLSDYFDRKNQIIFPSFKKKEPQ